FPASLALSAGGIASGGIRLATSPAQTAAPAFFGNTRLLEVGAHIWAAGAILLIGGWCLRGYRFRKWLLATAEPVSPSLRKRVEMASAKAGLAQAPRCVTIGEASGPGIVG